MKRFFILAVLMLCVSAAYAQSKVSDNAGDNAKEIVAGMKYKELKSIYSYKDWTSESDDRYSPGMMSVASFFIPGLGQMICGEVGRGFGWFGGAAGCWALIGVGAGLEVYGAYNGDAPDTAMVTAGSLLSIAAYLGLGAIEVCSIIDASRVAKVKNMYNQDLKKRGLTLNLYPSVDYIKMGNGIQPTTGLTLAMRF